MTILEAISVFFNLKKNALKMRKSLCKGGCKIGDFKAITLKFCKIVYKG